MLALRSIYPRQRPTGAAATGAGILVIHRRARRSIAFRRNCAPNSRRPIASTLWSASTSPGAGFASCWTCSNRSPRSAMVNRAMATGHNYHLHRRHRSIAQSRRWRPCPALNCAFRWTEGAAATAKAGCFAAPPVSAPPSAAPTLFCRAAAGRRRMDCQIHPSRPGRSLPPPRPISRPSGTTRNSSVSTRGTRSSAVAAPCAAAGQGHID